MADSLLVCAAKIGINFCLIAPNLLQPNPVLVEKCLEIAQSSKARILYSPHMNYQHSCGENTITDEITQAVREVDFIYTEVWTSMGEPLTVWEERIHLLRSYQVIQQLLDATDNPHI